MFEKSWIIEREQRKIIIAMKKKKYIYIYKRSLNLINTIKLGMHVTLQTGTQSYQELPMVLYTDST